MLRGGKSEVMFYEREIDYWDWSYLVEGQLDVNDYVK
jgi:hypothetical protein